MTYQEAYRKLEEYGQLHVLKYYDELDETQKQQLLQQVDETDFSILKNLQHRDAAFQTSEIAPMPAMELDEINRRRDEFTGIGLDAIRQGKVAAVLLAVIFRSMVRSCVRYVFLITCWVMVEPPWVTRRFFA